MVATMPVVGDVLAGKYALESVLGEGGMGVVFSARHTLTARRLAVKVLTRTSGAEAVARAVAEAQVMARIEHSNVVAVLDVGEQDGTVFLVMELLRGQSLADISRGRALPAVEAIQHLMPALCGVAAAHEAGIVHRDLKPENLFVSMDEAGMSYDTKVLDFGVAKITGDAASRQSARRTGGARGTPQYMAPEQVRGRTDIDARADVYALGVILYELLSGRLPFEAETITAIAVAIVNDEAIPLSSLVPTVPAELAAVIHRAIAKSPDERFQDVASFARSLEPFAGGARFTPPRRLPAHTARVSMQLEKVITVVPRKSKTGVTQDLVLKRRHDPRADPDSVPPPAPAAEDSGALPKPAGVPVEAIPAAAPPASPRKTPVRDFTPRPVAYSLDPPARPDVAPPASSRASRRWLWLAAPTALVAAAAAVLLAVFGSGGHTSRASPPALAAHPAAAVPEPTHDAAHAPIAPPSVATTAEPPPVIGAHTGPPDAGALDVAIAAAPSHHAHRHAQDAPATGHTHAAAAGSTAVTGTSGVIPVEDF